MFLAVENMSIIVVIIDDCPIFKKCSKTFAGVNFSCELSRPIYSVLSHLQLIVYFIHLFTVLRRFQHCTGHITTGSWEGRGNQYIQLVKVLYCKLPTNGKQLPAFPLEVGLGMEPQVQRWEARVLPLCHHGPPNY